MLSVRNFQRTADTKKTIKLTFLTFEKVKVFLRRL